MASPEGLHFIACSNQTQLFYWDSFWVTTKSEDKWIVIQSTDAESSKLKIYQLTPYGDSTMKIEDRC